MSPENQPNTTKICPTCGTRLGINATRCSVCGSNLAPSVAVSANKAISGPRIPSVTISLPLLFGLAVLLLVIGAGIVFAVTRSLGQDLPVAAVAATVSPTSTTTVTVTATPTETQTPTPEPTWTLPPPIEYKVAAGDTCGGIAYFFGVSVNSIVLLNDLSTDCTDLAVGQTLLIPHPTPTASPEPTRTLNPTEQAQAECETLEYIVKSGEALSAIAANYAVSIASIRQYNGMDEGEIVYAGQKLIIPLCEQMLETPTPTPVPPYPAPNLLLPADGASYTNPNDVITLQWSSVGELRQNEAYAVTIENVTEGGPRRVEYVTDQKLIVPQSYRPTSSTPNVFRWSVLPVRQIGTDQATGNPIWEPAGDASVQRVFSWVGSSSPVPTTEGP